jgi:rsbT antagonist protein RsbS
MSGGLISGAIPVIKLRDVLLVPIQIPPSDSQARQLLSDLLDTVGRTGSRKLVVDVSALDVIDSYLTRILYDLIGSAEKLGVAGAIVGIRPAVAITLVQMGIENLEVQTYLSLDLALEAFERCQ